MISNQILQTTIEGLKNITRAEFCICDVDGKVLASTFFSDPDYEKSVTPFVNSPADSQVIAGFHYFKVFDDHQLEYVLLAQTTNEGAYMIGKLATYQVESLLVAYKERFDKDNFIKNLLLDNLLLVDTHNRAKKLHIENFASRVVFVIEASIEKDLTALETIRDLFSASGKDYVTAVDEEKVILVHETVKDYTFEELDEVAERILGELNAIHFRDARVAYGTVVSELSEVSKSYKEADMALSVGRVFYTSDRIMAYAKLGIGRLIFQLPMNLCRMFIGEIFKDKSPDEFDDETLMTINKFFENSLNVSETSRQLYIHRNTLVYRLDKIQKVTGLDLRVFEDAITFKIALMVSKHMKSKHMNP